MRIGDGSLFSKGDNFIKWIFKKIIYEKINIIIRNK